MRQRTLIFALTFVCSAIWSAPVYAQLGSSCLRPLGIPDKWIEMQTPPWDPTDTFDPTGPTPDVYYDGYMGFDANEDQGIPMALTLYRFSGNPTGQTAWPLVVGESGSTNVRSAIEGCSGYLHGIGESFQSQLGSLTGVVRQSFTALIAQDPGAMWDPSANGGRGGVIGSAFPQSPRIIALPVLDPNTWVGSSSPSPNMVKIVGFFVSQQLLDTTSATRGYLTGWSQIAAPDVTARYGDYAQLSATFAGPGSPIVGLPIEFLYEGMVVATAETDATGTARPTTASFRVTAQPGEHPGAIRIRLRENASFFIADEAVANLTVLKRLPVITWPPPADLTYGTPLGELQLSAVADVSGQFSYTPAAGTILSVSPPEGTSLIATFTPAESESELYDQTTATTYVNVVPAPLAVTVNDASKLYLDPLPAFTFSAVGFVNGEGPSVLQAGPFVTSATASSDVGTYAVALESIGAANYAITLKPGVLTIVPRPTVTTLQSTTANPSTFGQGLSFTVAVSSGRGVPGGIVTVLSGGLPVATAPLVNGQATVSVSSLDAGNHALFAQYSGSGGFAASVSQALPHTINPASTTTNVTSSLNPSRAGQAVTFTSVVSPVAPGAGVPTGSIEYLLGGVVIGTVPLISGTAQLTIDTLTPGKYAIQARYLGTGNYRPSASAVIQQAVKGGGK